MAIFRGERDLYLRGKSGRIGRKRYLEESNLFQAEFDVKAHQMGEPSEAFYPQEILDNVIFLDQRKESRREIRDKKETLMQDVQRALLDLAAKQKNDNSSNLFPITGSNPDEIFNSYQAGSRYYDIISTARGELKRNYRTSDLWPKLSGRVFEDIAFGLLSRPMKDNEVLFSPKRTFQLAKKLYPQGRVVKSVFEQNFIVDSKRPYVPDGILVNTDKKSIEMVLEYTKDPRKDSLYGQYQRFSAMKRRYPQLISSSARFMLIVPSDSYSIEISGKKDVEVLRAPFSNADLKNRFYGIWR